MSINKATAYFLTTVIVLTATLQMSQAQENTSISQDTSRFDHIVNIVDPTEIKGTEVLLRDLI